MIGSERHRTTAALPPSMCDIDFPWTLIHLVWMPILTPPSAPLNVARLPLLAMNGAPERCAVMASSRVCFRQPEPCRTSSGCDPLIDCLQYVVRVRGERTKMSDVSTRGNRRRSVLCASKIIATRELLG